MLFCFLSFCLYATFVLFSSFDEGVHVAISSIIFSQANEQMRHHLLFLDCMIQKILTFFYQKQHLPSNFHQKATYPNFVCFCFTRYELDGNCILYGAYPWRNAWIRNYKDSIASISGHGLKLGKNIEILICGNYLIHMKMRTIESWWKVPQLDI